MDGLKYFEYSEDLFDRVCFWNDFLIKNKFDFNLINKIIFKKSLPIIIDNNGNKFSIDFNNDKKNYHKKKSGIKSELISKAMGAGKYGLKLLDLTAGLGVDSVFLSQLGYLVTGLERNPLIYLALAEAKNYLSELNNLHFFNQSAIDYLQQLSISDFDVVYFDPMFPEKIKSALPKQEMVFFRNLVGDDLDADLVVKKLIEDKKISRIVIKRPLKSAFIYQKPKSSINGKLIRFDIYGV